MDSFFSSQNPNPAFLPPPPGIPFPFPTAAAAAATETPTAANVVTTTVGIPTPILIPKLEPSEGWLATPNTQVTHQPIISSGSHPHFNFFDETLPGSSDENNNTTNDAVAYSGFNQISETFRIAFAKGLQQFQHSTNDQNYAVFDLNMRAIDENDAVFDLNSRATDESDGVLDLNSRAIDENDEVFDLNSRAIVPVPPPENNYPMEAAGAVAAVTTPRRRMKELVRITDFGINEKRHFREVVRRTRMIYDSLRVLSTTADELETIRKVRPDLKASNTMRNCNLWLNRDKRIVGEIPGVCIGDVFLYRMELCVVGLHGHPQAGIDYLPGNLSSNGEPIATSVIVSGGYEDDMDAGDVIIYSGHGGQDKNSKQVLDQKMEGGNLAMERSMRYGIEVRVIRGIRYEGTASASGKVYVYDGLYRILNYWFDTGKSGYGVYKYKLGRIDGQPKMGSAVLKEAIMLRNDPLSVKPMCCLSLDISNRKESVAVRLFNDIDRSNDPLCYEYLAKTVFPLFVFHQSGRATGCECVGGCIDGCFCATKNGNEFPYNHNGILLKGKPVIFECGPFCRCPPHCRNRVTQNGLKNRLEVFRSRETGWGVRSLDLIQAGAFICEYTGVVLTKEQAQVMTMNGDSLIHPNRFSDRWAEWGDLSLIDPNHERPSIPPLDFALDVSSMRNVACYMSHSSSPNVLVQFVLYDHNNLMFPHLMLFAMESIPPMRELSLDYGVADEWVGKLSICN